MTKICRIGLCHHGAPGRLQRYFAGATDYVEETGGVTITDCVVDLPVEARVADKPPPWKDRFDAVMVCVGKDSGSSARHMADWVLSGGVPAVCLGADWHDSRLLQFRVSPRSLAELAAEHLLECGCQSFIFLGYAGSSGSVERGAAFRDLLAAQRLSTLEIVVNTLVDEAGDFTSALKNDKEVENALLRAQRPVGVFALNDCYSAAIAGRCRQLELEIPRDVKILGVEDLPMAAAHRPALSSIRAPLEQVARLAMRTLHTMVVGRLRGRPRTEVPAVELSARTSTIGSPELSGDVAEVADYIARHACSGLTVNRLVEIFDLSRRSFERRFREVYGCSPGDQIRRLRLERAKDLLSRSEISISRIGAMVGYAETAGFCKFFRQQTNLSPREFRKEQGRSE